MCHGASPGRPRIDPGARPRRDHGAAADRPRSGPRAAQERPRNDPRSDDGSPPDRPQSDLQSTPIRDVGSTLDRLRADLRSTPDLGTLINGEMARRDLGKASGRGPPESLDSLSGCRSSDIALMWRKRERLPELSFVRTKMPARTAMSAHCPPLHAPGDISCPSTWRSRCVRHDADGLGATADRPHFDSSAWRASMRTLIGWTSRRRGRFGRP